MSHITQGQVIERISLESIRGDHIDIPSADSLVHLQFRRFAGCPFCTAHLASVARRHDEIVAAGIQEVVMFHSTAEALRQHEPLFPFAIVADPGKELYGRFGVESSVGAVIDPRGWATAARGAWLKHVNKVSGVDPRGGALGLPADFLIDTGGAVVAAKYGTRADDQWSVDEILGLSRG